MTSSSPRTSFGLEKSLQFCIARRVIIFVLRWNMRIHSAGGWLRDRAALPPTVPQQAAAARRDAGRDDDGAGSARAQAMWGACAPALCWCCVGVWVWHWDGAGLAVLADNLSTVSPILDPPPPAPPVHPALELPFTPGFVCTSVGPDCPAAKVRSWVAAVGVVLVVVGVCALLASQGDLPLPFRDLSLPFLVVSLPFHVLSVTFHCLSSWPFTAFSTALPRPVTAF